MEEKTPVTIGPDSLNFLNLYESSAELQLAQRPIGYLLWGDKKLEVICATNEQKAESRKLAGDTGKRALISALLSDEEAFDEAFSYAAFKATREVLDQTMILERRYPTALRVMLKEAVLAFLAEGPVSNTWRGRMQDHPSLRTVKEESTGAEPGITENKLTTSEQQQEASNEPRQESSKETELHQTT